MKNVHFCLEFCKLVPDVTFDVLRHLGPKRPNVSTKISGGHYSLISKLNFPNQNSCKFNYYRYEISLTSNGRSTTPLEMSV